MRAFVGKTAATTLAAKGRTSRRSSVVSFDIVGGAASAAGHTRSEVERLTEVGHYGWATRACARLSGVCSGTACDRTRHARLEQEQLVASAGVTRCAGCDRELCRRELHQTEALLLKPSRKPDRLLRPAKTKAKVTDELDGRNEAGEGSTRRNCGDMLRQILLATDLSARCDRAFDRAVLLAREAGARLTIATALERSPDDLVELEAQPRWRRNDGLADARRQIRDDLEGKGVDARIVVRRARAGELITRMARENSYDLIVTGIARSTGPYKNDSRIDGRGRAERACRSGSRRETARSRRLSYRSGRNGLLGWHRVPRFIRHRPCSRRLN